MSVNSNQRDKALEALDFIINVLKEHEKTLDDSIGELESVTEKVEKIDKINVRIDGVEDKISNLQSEITNLSDIITNPPKVTICAEAKKVEPKVPPAEAQLGIRRGSSMVLKCKQWSDFQAFATHAQTLTFSLKEEEKMYQVSAIDGNQIFIYMGPVPELSTMLTVYLSLQLEVPKQNVIEGTLS